MDKILKIKTLIAFLMFFLFSVSQSYAQNISSFSKLKERGNKLYQGDQIFSGLVVKTYITNQPKSISEVKDGLISGKIIEFNEDLAFVSKAYRDTSEINRLNIQISIKKHELEQAIQDTVKASKEQNDFLNYEIGGNEKLLKLKEKDAEGKLNKNKKEIYDKYEQYVQTNKQCTRRFQDIQLQINNLNQQIKSENDKPIYIPKKSMEYLIINGLKEGKAIIYDSLGNKFGEGEYLNDKQNGFWTYYYPSGSKLAQGNFISGDGGNKGKSGVPKNGREGQWFFYQKNGKIDTDAIFMNGKLNGNCKFYYENGQIKEEKEFKSDKIDGLVKLYYENGTIKESGTWINGEANGKFLFYNEKGTKYSECTYINGEKNGIEITFDENGSKTAEYYLTNNLKNGEEKVYYTSSKLKEQRFWKMGKRYGSAKVFYESGQIQVNGNFLNDKLHGDFIVYYENGKTRLKAKYDTTSLAKDYLIGDFYEYNEDGTIKEHGFAHGTGLIEDKSPKNETNFSKNEMSKTYKCKCCKGTINGISDGVDKDGNEPNEFMIDFTLNLYKDPEMLKMANLGNLYSGDGQFNSAYDVLRRSTYKFCSMKCARTCYE
jgi:antitoxin component YwqK of YwqJK toxin-antitoxin module